MLVEVSLFSAEDTKYLQEVLWVTCSLVCLPSCLLSLFSWLCWRHQPWMAGEVSGFEGVKVWSKGTSRVAPQQRYLCRVDGHCPCLLGASACPSPVWPSAFASAAALVSPSRAWLLAGQCWPPAVPPAIRCVTRSSTVLAALPLPCYVALKLLGKLEDMPKQWTPICFSRALCDVREFTLSSPSMNFAGHSLDFPRSEQCYRLSSPIKGYAWPSWTRQTVGGAQKGWQWFLLHLVARQSTLVCDFGPVMLVTDWCRGAALLSFLLLSATITRLFPALKTRESK